jgi:hypothetical protein
MLALLTRWWESDLVVQVFSMAVAIFLLGNIKGLFGMWHVSTPKTLDMESELMAYLVSRLPCTRHTSSVQAKAANPMDSRKP